MMYLFSQLIYSLEFWAGITARAWQLRDNGRVNPENGSKRKINALHRNTYNGHPRVTLIKTDQNSIFYLISIGCLLDIIVGPKTLGSMNHTLYNTVSSQWHWNRTLLTRMSSWSQISNSLDYFSISYKGENNVSLYVKSRLKSVI